MLWVTNWFRKGARDTYRDVRVKIARVNAFLQEHISGIAIVQLFRRERVAAKAFAEVNDAHRAANIESIFYYSVFYPALDFLSAVGMAVDRLVRRVAGRPRGRMTIGAVVAFLQYSKRFYRPLMDLSEKYNILQAAMASSERIFQLLDAPPTIAAPEDPVAPAGPLRGEIAFEDVRFSYKPGEEILKGVSFHVPPGQTVALVGATGAGKSTILNLLLRFYDVTSGRVLVDGERRPPLRPRSAARALRHRPAGHVPLHGHDRRERLVLRPGDAARADRGGLPRGRARPAPRAYSRRPRREAHRAGRRPLGRREAARLVRARARPRPAHPDPRRGDLLASTRRPRRRSSARSQRVLAGRTSLVVAHRLSTIVRADRILVLSHGEVKESGTHAELLEKGGLYARLYALQLKDREAAA